MLLMTENKKTAIELDEYGTVISMKYNGDEIVSGEMPLFRVALRDKDSKRIVADTHNAAKIERKEEKNGCVFLYCGFDICKTMTVKVSVKAEENKFVWGISVENTSEYKTEWMDFPLVSVKQLKKDKRAVLFPYNEGAYVDDLTVVENSWFAHSEPEYPSIGAYAMFPNMVFAQFLSYLWKDGDGKSRGVYFGAHDKKRGVKAIDFYRNENKKDLVISERIFCGVNAGESWGTDYDIVWQTFDGTWENAAEIYREWFEGNLPPRLSKIAENENLPEWYKDSPLVITYPVRGIHDTDEMNPNKLFPYTNALPLVDEIQKTVDSRLMVILMHWEGTAPWAPPYVWPPYGGEENFNEFLRELHKRNDLLGVYCSGFGYTLKSNLVDDYEAAEKYEKEGLEEAMCAGPDGKVAISRICTAQRSGYDICPASKRGAELLNDAYRPLLESDVDYVQILDQNHGGGQYFCYSDKHGHPSEPGVWMTENMQKLLGEWNEIAGKKLLGCESAAAEPFMGNLLFSDNRFELDWRIGVPVPLYAYIYHEYLRNFMGNQCCSPFPPEYDTLRFRMAYSFAAGDCLTLVLTPDGEFMVNWGCHDFSKLPDKKKALEFAKNLVAFYKNKAKEYLYNGRMKKTHDFTSPTVEYECSGRMLVSKCIFSSAWETKDGKTAQIFVNPTDNDVDCIIDPDKNQSQTVTIPKNNAEIVILD